LFAGWRGTAGRAIVAGFCMASPFNHCALFACFCSASFSKPFVVLELGNKQKLAKVAKGKTDIARRVCVAFGGKGVFGDTTLTPCGDGIWLLSLNRHGLFVATKVRRRFDVQPKRTPSRAAKTQALRRVRTAPRRPGKSIFDDAENVDRKY
jgi:hypothetical protein